MNAGGSASGGEEGGRVVIVPTPIGNLGDITLRALDALRSADLIACEDTRHSRRLLDHHGIDRPLVSFHEHNEAARTAQLVDQVRHGTVVAVVSDAGMPGVSDPGLRLVAASRSAGITVEVLPGPSAVLTALVGSGLPTEAFFFGGFLPVKKGGRERALREALERPSATSIYFESPHRVQGTLDMLAALDPRRFLCLAREMTKLHETWHRGTAGELAAAFATAKPRGEFVLLIAPRKLPAHLRRIQAG